ncbi:gamma-glutamyl-gamma-aminobutyrate hydrolase family protein, partial [Acinetobacter baumannii]
GGQVVRAPEVVHGKTSDIKVEEECPLFDGMPETFPAMRYHSLVAQEEGFPDTLSVVARDTNLGLIMALRHKIKPLYGVQFHPESI